MTILQVSCIILLKIQDSCTKEAVMEYHSKTFQPSDCLLVNACKEFFHGKKHSETCDKFMEFLCERINNGGKYSNVIKGALSKERFVLMRFLMMNNWNNLFRYIYGNIELCLSFLSENKEEIALKTFFLWHGVIYKSVQGVNCD